MKAITRCSVGLALVFTLAVPEVCAQYRGGSYYTRKVAPQQTRPTAPPQPQQPAAAAPAPAPVDPEKAKAEKEAAVKRTVEFQKKRAEAGSETAQYDLGMRYVNGDGVEQDLTLARKWLKASAEKGHKFAAKKLAVIEAAEPKAADATKEPPAPKPAEAGADSKPGPKPAE